MALAKARLNAGGIHIKPELTLEPNTAVACDYKAGEDKEDELSGRYEHRRVAYESPVAQAASETKNSTTYRRVAHEDVKEESAEEAPSKPLEDLDIDPTDKVKPTPTSAIAKKNDPLSAFGFMARNALRPAQTQFNSALSFLIDAADAAQEIRLLERQYNVLLEKKKRLSAAQS